MRILASCLLGVAIVCQGSDLGRRIEKILSESPEARQSFWGIRVCNTETGSVLYAQNEDKFFVPASNTKLFTTSLALQRLGPDYKFVTRVEAASPPDSDGRVGELRLVGGGDPNLSARILPYSRDEEGPDPLAAIEALASILVAKGLRVVDGDIVGDDTAYVYEPYPDGWAVDDPVWEYGAPVSALTLNDNAFTLYTSPGNAPDDPAVLRLWPAVEYLTLHNRTRTVEASETKPLRIERLPGSREIVVSGDVLLKAQTRSDLLAVNDPAMFAAAALRDALASRGVRVSGIRAVHRPRGDQTAPWTGVELARHESRPLAEALQVINKVSQNLHTELVLLEIARQRLGIGSREDGLIEITEYLREIGVPDKQYNFEDASGLSRLTLVTPSTLNAVLLHMYRSPHRQVWIGTLPVGGVDGTLDKRFAAAADGSLIHAKTGSISHVSTLSGYALRKDGQVYGFTIMANNYNSPHAPVRKVIDRIALALLQ